MISCEYLGIIIWYDNSGFYYFYFDRKMHIFYTLQLAKDNVYWCTHKKQFHDKLMEEIDGTPEET